MNKTSALLATLVLLSGCQSFAPPATHETAAPTNTVEQPSGSFSEDTLYALLAAELAGQRDHYDVALANYLAQAKATQDPGVAERAFRIAEYVEDDEAALDSALIWAQAAPDNLEAQRAAAIQLARVGRYEDAMGYMENVLQKQGQTNFDFLALSAAETDAKTRAGLLNSFDRLLQKYPNDSQLKFGKAVLLHQDGRIQEALQLLGHSKDPGLVLLHARLLQELNRPSEALDLLQDGVKANPGDKRLGLNYGRLLLDSGRTDQAKREFARLLEQFPDDDDLRFSLALVSMQAQDWDEAQGYLEELIQHGSHLDTVHFNLATVYREKGSTDSALAEYAKVPSGANYLPAQLQRTLLLMDAGRADEAAQSLAEAREAHPEFAIQLYLIEAQCLIERQRLDPAWRLLNKALSQFPDDPSLLYTRAMLAEKKNDLKQMEQDLRRIIAREPNNAMAINSLGYILADRTTRYNEARQLIERAHVLAPKDAAILDSLGWVSYRQGDLKQAEDYLRRALKDFPDAEVAAHLGEVLWVEGQQQEAREVWRKAMERQGDNPTLLRTLERLTGSRKP